MAGLCNQMFHAALLVGVGLLGFPDSQNHGYGGTSPRRSEFCAEGPVGQPSQGVLLQGRGQRPIVLYSGLACFMGWLHCPTFRMLVNDLEDG